MSERHGASRRFRVYRQRAAGKSALAIADIRPVPFDFPPFDFPVRSRLKPIAAKAKMLKGHLPELLSYFRQPITNAMSEGFNSRIQSIKSSARGFRAFENYRARILFYCGKLDMRPEGITH